MKYFASPQLNLSQTEFGLSQINTCSRRDFLKQTAAVSAFSAPGVALADTFFNQPLKKQHRLSANPIAFNGERQDPVTGNYLLGNGVRMYSPTLMRFHAMDSLSPFGLGGVNSYAYCLGDPVNQRDPSGHVAITSLIIGAIVGAVLGASISAIAEGVKVAITGEKFDWKQVGIGAALGLIGGVFGAAAKGASFGVKLGLAAAEAGTSGMADFMINAGTGMEAGEALKSAALGAFIGFISFGAGEALGALRSAGKKAEYLYETMGGEYLYARKVETGNQHLVYYFYDQYKGRNRLNVVGHGRVGGGFPMLGNSLLGEDLVAYLNHNNLDPKNGAYDFIRLLGCHTGEETVLFEPFAHTIARRMGVPVKAFKGTVTLKAQINNKPARPSAAVGLDGGFKIEPVKNNPRHNYQPVYFTP